MSDRILSVSLIATVASVLSLMLKKDRPEFALILSMSAGIIIIFLILPSAGRAAEVIQTISDIAGINSEYIGIIIKSCAVAMVTEISASTCRDSGNSSLAVKLEIAGRIAIVLLATPIINTLFNVILSVIR